MEKGVVAGLGLLFGFIGGLTYAHIGIENNTIELSSSYKSEYKVGECIRNLGSDTVMTITYVSNGAVEYSYEYTNFNDKTVKALGKFFKIKDRTPGTELFHPIKVKCD